MMTKLSDSRENALPCHEIGILEIYFIRRSLGLDSLNDQYSLT